MSISAAVEKEQQEALGLLSQLSTSTKEQIRGIGAVVPTT